MRSKARKKCAKMHKNAENVLKMLKNALSAVKLDFGLMHFFGPPSHGEKTFFLDEL